MGRARGVAEATLGSAEWERLLAEGAHAEVAQRHRALLRAVEAQHARAVRVDGAARSARRPAPAARALATGAVRALHGEGASVRGSSASRTLLDELPQRQTRLAKWPVATLFPFVALPKRHLILKPP